MPEPHGRSLSNWLRRYRAGAGGAATPPLGDVLQPSILVDDVHKLVTPLPQPIWVTDVNIGPLAAERSTLEIIGPQGGVWILSLQSRTAAFRISYFTPDDRITLTGQTRIVLDNVWLGPAETLIFEGSATLAALGGAFAQAWYQYPPIPAVAHAYRALTDDAPIFIPPGMIMYLWGINDNVGLTLSLRGLEVPSR